MTVEGHKANLKILKGHHGLIFQLQSFPYDPKYIDLYHVNTNFPSKDPSVLDASKNRSLILRLAMFTLAVANACVFQMHTR